MLHTLTKTSNVGNQNRISLSQWRVCANGQDAVSPSIQCDRACFMSERLGDVYLATGARALLFPLRWTLCVWCSTPGGMLWWAEAPPALPEVRAGMWADECSQAASFVLRVPWLPQTHFQMFWNLLSAFSYSTVPYIFSRVKDVHAVELHQSERLGLMQ